eukprot:g7627.t1
MESQKDSHLRAELGPELFDKVQKAKVFVVGAGGIGCELLKNLVLSGFTDIECIDLDTIDVSNLNRQFLFRREHVGLSKAEVAKEAVLQYNPDVKIDAKYDVAFFEKFTLVMNALDNLEARNHVNRMCLAAKRPLIESGTQGYLGQVTPIWGRETECFECQPHPAPKTYAVCTIRNTPDQPVHCVVWAKAAFATLFGPEDDSNLLHDKRVDPRSQGFVDKIYHDFFIKEVAEQLEKKERWKDRKPPEALPPLAKLLEQAKLDSQAAAAAASGDANKLDSMRVMTVAENAAEFVAAARTFIEQRKAELGELSFNKDDDDAMSFVAALANLRMQVFGIPLQSHFALKGIAGNIVHAIATTNAIAAGLIVLEAFKVVAGDRRNTRTVWIKRAGPKLLQPQKLEAPNSACYTCGGDKPMLTLRLDTTKFTVERLFKKVLQKRLCMVDPALTTSVSDKELGVYEDLEEADNNPLKKPMAEFFMGDKEILKVVDYQQDMAYQLQITHDADISVQEEKYPEQFVLEGKLHSAAQADGAAKPSAGSQPLPAAEPGAGPKRKDRTQETDTAGKPKKRQRQNEDAPNGKREVTDFTADEEPGGAEVMVIDD